MAEENQNDILSKIDEIVISNAVGNEIFLDKVVNKDLRSKKLYREVNMSNLSLTGGNLSQVGIQIANQSITLNQIAKQAPNGLFTATVDPVHLSKFADGTTTTMVRDASNRLVEHSGFAAFGINIPTNPAIILSAGMQAMSAISGTYYLNQINTQLLDLNQKLEELLSYHHDTRIGKLITAEKNLTEIRKRKTVDSVDLGDVRNYKKTVDEVYNAYSYSLERQNRDLENLSYFKNEEEILNKINFSIRIIFEASKLSIIAQLIEISARLRMQEPFEIINGLIKQLENNYIKSYYYNYEREIERIYSLIKMQSYKKLSDSESKYKKNFEEKNDDSDTSFTSALAFIGLTTLQFRVSKNKINGKLVLEDKYLTSIREDIKNIIKEEKVDDLVKEVIELQYRKADIAYIPTNENEQRLFVAIENV